MVGTSRRGGGNATDETFIKYFGEPLARLDALRRCRLRHPAPPNFLRRSLSYVRSHAASRRREVRAALRPLVSQEIEARIFAGSTICYEDHDDRIVTGRPGDDFAPPRWRRREGAGCGPFLHAWHGRMVGETITWRAARAGADRAEPSERDCIVVDSSDDERRVDGGTEETSSPATEASPASAPTPGVIPTEAFGKKFPPFRPGTRPARPRSSFALFCEAHTKQLTALLEESNADGVSPTHKARPQRYEMKLLWHQLSEEDQLFWTKEECWDRQRYQRDLALARLEYIEGTAVARNDPDGPRAKDVEEGRRRVVLTEFVRESDGLCESVPRSSSFSPSSKDTPSPRPIFSVARLMERIPTVPPRAAEVEYLYLYMGPEDVPAMQRETRKDRRCPFCGHNAITDEGLMLHLHASHGDFSYRARKDKDAKLYVLVRRKTLQALPPDIPPACPDTFAYASRGKRRARVIIPALGRPAAGASSDPDASDDVPIRQYFHSKTLIPYRGNEWDLDSDDEGDEEWRHQLAERLLDEFDDVSPKEKLFMKAWNRFIYSDIIIPDKAVPSLCLEFVEKHFRYLKKHHLRQQFLLHLLTLWDSSVLSSVAVRTILTCYDALAATGHGDHGDAIEGGTKGDAPDAGGEEPLPKKQKVGSASDA